LYDQWKTMNEDGKWRFTSPTHVVLAFAQALEELKEEGGVPARHARYDQNQRLLAENFRALGFVPYLDPAVQGPIITTFRYPAGARFTFQQMYEYIKARGYVLYPGKVMEAETFRVGNIGEIYPEDIAKLSAILADFLKEVAA
ncbi:MAG: 2-aminoethylphosphonate--pyruvate transaminase, partial [Evtepia gabavorous]